MKKLIILIEKSSGYLNIKLNVILSDNLIDTLI